MDKDYLKALPFKILDKIKSSFKNLFVADNSIEPKETRRKQVRVGLLIGVIFIAVCVFIVETGNKGEKKSLVKNVKEKEVNNSGISNLAKGISHEAHWSEVQGKEVEELKNKQIESELLLKEFKEKMLIDKVSREEIADAMLKMKAELEESYNRRLEEELGKKTVANQLPVIERRIESKKSGIKKRVRKIGDYIPANSYVQAKMISGVDAGVGITAESDPRQALLRITGEAISAGLGQEYLKTKRLIGCLLSVKAVGDISSEKAYLDGVILTCAVDKNTAIEVPVKAYITSRGKSGVRGEIVSREGDMVLKSFLSGITSGFGSSIAQMSQPQVAITGGGLVTTGKQQTRNIVGSGLGSGANSAGDTLSQYFIKRAEQYQPVISVNEGTEVYVVFQEGFSLKLEDQDDKTS
ncbi:conjugal transfer pilus assembly protein TraB (plasmid) [Rickettsiales bacterium Ac37b]|nr:conjugal transfer pilus assembly protein TraB [Rickettsiales bacterium Ac37b]